MTTREAQLQSAPISLVSPGYTNWVRFNQYAMVPLWRLVTATIVRRRVRIDLTIDDLRPGIRYMIAANHQSQFDTFVICRELPWSIWKRLNVFRVLVYYKVFLHPLGHALMVAIGGFPATPVKNMTSGLEATRAYMARGQTIMIFPEARRTLPRATKPHNGVAVLAAEPNVRIIPVHIQWTRGRRRSYQMTIGKPLSSGLSAQKIMDEIYALPLP